MLIFSGDKLHCGTSPTDQNARVVLNINYLPGITTENIPFIPDWLPMKTDKLLKIYLKVQECTTRKQARKLIKKYDKKYKKLSILNDH